MNIKHKGRRNWVRIISFIVAVIGYTVGCGTFSYMVYGITMNEIMQHQAVEQANKKVASWPTPDIEAQRKIARAYNKTITPGLTRVGDGLSADGKTTSARNDKKYMSALNLDNNSGLMATISIPKISSNLKIYHTTDDDALMSGVGHLYGTDLPIGDKNTISALAAHSGEPDRLYFTRLGELKIGDFFYITVLGKQMGYQIDHIDVVNPDNIQSLFKYKNDGEARVTLITCTPVGINTQRLLVSGVRKSIPDPIPEASTQKDWHFIVFLIALGIFIFLILLGLLIALIRWWKHRYRAAHEARTIQ